MIPAPKKRQEITSATLVQTLGLIMTFSGLVVVTSFAADPSWWSTPGASGAPSAVVAEEVVTNNGVVSTNYAPSPYAAVTQGQLKQFTARAVDELNANLPGGAGTNLNALVQGWSQDYATNNYGSTNNPYAPYKPGDFTVMNIGQLKTIGNMVWSQLVAGGYTNAVPSWLAQNTNSDHSVAVLGQLKEVFNFDLSSLNQNNNTVTNLTTTLNADGSVTLTWSFSGSSTGAVVIGGLDSSGNWDAIATLSASATTVTLTADQVSPYSSIGASNAPTNPLASVASSATNNPDSATPRYALIDMGTNFVPVAINSSGMVAGNTTNSALATFAGGAAVGNAEAWNQGSLKTLTTGLLGTAKAYGLGDNGIIYGSAFFTYAAPNYDYTEIAENGLNGNPLTFTPFDFPTNLTEEHACDWPSMTSAPVDLDQQYQSDTFHNGFSTGAVFGQSVTYSSCALGGNSRGVFGFCVGTYATFSALFSATAPPASLVPVPFNIVSAPPNVVPANQGQTIPSYGEGGGADVETLPYGGYVNLSAVSANHWCGTANGTVTNNDTLVSTGTNYLMIDGTNTSVSVNGAQGSISANGINTNGVVVGNIVTYYYNTSYSYTNNSVPVMIPYGGSPTNLPGHGTPQGINNYAITSTNGVSTPAPQIVGSYTNGAPCLWDETYYNGTPTTNSAYIQKNLNKLIPGAIGTNAGPWNITSAVGINDAGAIVGTASYTPTGTADPIPAGQHGVMLLPVQIVTETTPGNGDFEPITDNGLDGNAKLPIFASETGHGMTESDSGGYTMTAVLSTDLSATGAASINLTYTINGGSSYTGTLAETGSGSGVFEDSSGANILTLTPSNQTTSSTAPSTLNAMITIPSLSISSQPVTLSPTDTLTYQASAVLLDVFLPGPLSTTTTNTITASFYGNQAETDGVTLVETGVNTRIFRDSTANITLTMTAFTGGTSMNISVSEQGATPPSFGGTLTETTATSLQYSNYTRTYGTAGNETPATDGQAVFYVQFPGTSTATITLTSGGNSVTTTASPVSGQPGLLRTGKLVLLAAADTFSAPGFTTLNVSPPAGGGNPAVEFQMYGQTIPGPLTYFDAYLGFGIGVGDGSVHLGQLQSILTQKLGWAVPTIHPVSVKTDVLNELPNHSIWYMFTHGLTKVYDTPPLVSFRLYNSADPNDHGQAELFPADVAGHIQNNSYELVFFNGCFSADMTPGSAANAFVTNFRASNYVGWQSDQVDGAAYNAGKTFFVTLETHRHVLDAIFAVNQFLLTDTVARNISRSNLIPLKANGDVINLTGSAASASPL